MIKSEILVCSFFYCQRQNHKSVGMEKNAFSVPVDFVTFDPGRDNKKAKNPVPVAKKDPTYYPDIYALSHESDIPASSYNKAEIQESAHFQARVLQS